MGPSSFKEIWVAGILGGGCESFLFSPQTFWGRWTQFDLHIFFKKRLVQNHQQDNLARYPPETSIAHENPIVPGKYHQNGGFPMAMLVYRSVYHDDFTCGIIFVGLGGASPVEIPSGTSRCKEVIGFTCALLLLRHHEVGRSPSVFLVAEKIQSFVFFFCGGGGGWNYR